MPLNARCSELVKSPTLGSVTENIAGVGPETPLESWKEIAAYLQKDVTTVRRWERKEGLPVHRHSHSSRSSVYAYASEIDGWRTSRRIVPERAAPIWRQLAHPSFAVTIILSLILAGNGGRPQMASAQQRGQTRTMICAGSDCGEGLSPDVESLLIKGGVDYEPIRKLRAVLPSTKAGVYQWLLSPDASRILYSPSGNYSAPSGEVIIVKVDGSGSRTVFHGGRPLAWSADGNRVLIGSGDEMVVMVWIDAANGSVEKLPSHWNVLKPVVSPNGKYIAFSAGRDRNSVENVIVMASNGSEENVVSASPAYQEPVGWTPDSKNLVYQQYGDSVRLWSVEIENGKVQGPPVNVGAELEKSAQVLGISRSGALYYSIPSSTRDIYTASMDPATGRVTSAPAPVPVLRTGSNFSPKWAPDSRRLLYLTRDAGKGGLEIHLYSSGAGSFNAGQEEPVPAAANASPIGAYCWTEDGASVVLHARDNARPLIRIGLTDGKVTPLLPQATWDRLPPFQLASCSGNRAVGTMASGVKMHNMLDGSTKDIYQSGPDTIVADAMISHDGRNVAFTTGTLGAGPLPPPSAIHVVSSNGGPVRDVVVTAAPAELQYSGITWSADDRFLYFTRRPDAHSPFELFRVPAGGGAPESMGLKLGGLRQIDIAPDGRRIAFSVGSGGTQVWAVQGFLREKK